MALISIIPDFYPTGDARLLARAEELKPVLHHAIKEPIGAFKLKERYSSEKNDLVLHHLPHITMGKGENIKFPMHATGS